MGRDPQEVRTPLKPRSRIGFGASPLGGVFGPVDEAEAERAVHCAIDLGVDLFDVSPYYGLTLAEERLGRFLGARRSRILVSTKAGRYGDREFDFSRARAFRSIDESLERLRTDYVDLWLAHDIEYGDPRQIVEETLPAMREVQRFGKARHIGISGFPPVLLRDVAAAAGADAVLTYCHGNLLDTSALDVLAPFARNAGVCLINASPLHMGILTEAGPPPWHPAPEAVRRAGAEVVRLCQARGLRVTDVALRFAAAHPAFATTLVGMSTQAEVERNVRALEEETPAGLIEEILRLPQEHW